MRRFLIVVERANGNFSPAVGVAREQELEALLGVAPLHDHLAPGP